MLRSPVIYTPFGQRQRTGWMVTFADMMALLLTFFIIMLSYSTVDSGKYNDVMSSLGQAFGTEQMASQAVSSQNAGTIEREQPMLIEPVIIEDVRQPDVVELMQQSMADEISQGRLEVAREQGKLVIRFPEHAAFPSASANLNEKFLPVIARLAHSVSETSGEIVVSGHTDDIPINNGQFRSNWDLSAARAVSVVHALLQNESIDPRRMVALGYADTRPRAYDATGEARKSNRRVELVIELEK